MGLKKKKKKLALNIVETYMISFEVLIIDVSYFVFDYSRHLTILFEPRHADMGLNQIGTRKPLDWTHNCAV